MASASSSESLYIEMVLKWREVADCSRRANQQQETPYHRRWTAAQCRRWWLSHLLSGNDVGYTSKFVTEIFRRQVMQTAVDEDRQFVLDTLWHSQPVQVAKKWRGALEPPFREDKTDGRVCWKMLFAAKCKTENGCLKLTLKKLHVHVCT